MNPDLSLLEEQHEHIKVGMWLREYEDPTCVYKITKIQAGMAYYSGYSGHGAARLDVVEELFRLIKRRPRDALDFDPEEP